MLTNLKKSIRQGQNDAFVTEAAIDHTDDDYIKGVFLDDMLDNAEDDPALLKLIDNIPESGDEVDIDANLESLTENFIPESHL